jgi:hypothetical protein
MSTNRHAMILGMKPEPGNESEPKGKSPLAASTTMPAAINTPPATWSARTIMAQSSVKGARL